MMRILIINSEYPPIGGGAGNATAHIARRLAKMGHEVVCRHIALWEITDRGTT